MIVYLEGQVGHVDQLVVGDREKVEEAQLRERSRLYLFHTVMVDEQLLQRGKAIKRFLDSKDINHSFTHFALKT